MNPLARFMAGLGGRRFLLTLGCGVATTVLQWNGKLDPAGNSYFMTISATVGAFIVGNVIQKRNEAKASQETP